MAIAKALLEKLVKVAPFQGLKAAEAGTFFDAAEEQQAKKGEVLFAEGAEGDALLVILDGRVQVTKKGVELATLEGQVVLGEMALLGGEARSATATALGDLTYLRIPARRVQEALAADQLAALKVVANLAVVMSKRLALINVKLVDSLGGGKRKEELADFGRILNSWSF